MNDELLRDMMGIISPDAEPTERERAIRRVVEYAEGLGWGNDYLNDEPKPKKRNDKEQEKYLNRIGYDE